MIKNWAAGIYPDGAETMISQLKTALSLVKIRARMGTLSGTEGLISPHHLCGSQVWNGRGSTRARVQVRAE
jgi:hypothetical protein